MGRHPWILRGLAILSLTLVLQATTGQLAVVDAAGRMFYVATNGSDSNPGTFDLPWLTIQKAANTMLPGDTVTVLAGNYPTQRVQVTTSGTAAAPIVYQAQGTVWMKGFTVTGNYITIKGFDITGTDDNWKQGWGIFVQASNCDIENNYVYFATDGGIELYADPTNPTAVANCTVRNNRLYRNALAGIVIEGRNHLVEGNEIWGTIQYHPYWTTTHSGADADGMRFFGQGHVIRSNYIHDIHYGIPENINPHIDCFQTWTNTAGGFETASNIIIERNFCTNLDAQAANEVGQGFMIENAGRLVIRNNIIQAYRGANVWGTPNLIAANNDFTGILTSTTAYSPQGVQLNSSSNATVENNIFYDIPGKSLNVRDITSTVGLAAGYNLEYRSDGLALAGTAYPHDLWNVNPLFVNVAGNDYHLTSGSKAVDDGTTLASVTDDRDGRSRPQGAADDVGAYEYASQTPTAVYLSILAANAAMPSADGRVETGLVAGSVVSGLAVGVSLTGKLTEARRRKRVGPQV